MAIEVVTGSVDEYIDALKRYGEPQAFPPIYADYNPETKEVTLTVRMPFGALTYVERNENATKEDLHNRLTELKVKLTNEGYTVVTGYLILP